MCTERSGSSLLLELLTQTGRLGHVDGFFVGSGKLAAEGFDIFAPKYERDHRSPEGHFATRIVWSYWDSLQPWAKPNLTEDYLNTFTHFIHLKRRDKVAQAVSRYLALHSGKWRSYQKQKEPYPDYNYAGILVLYEKIIRNEKRTYNFIVEKPYFYNLEYEELIEREPYSVNGILNWLYMDLMPISWQPKLTYEKLNNPLTPEYIERFRKDYGL